MEEERDNSATNYQQRENLWDEAWPITGDEGMHELSVEPDNLDEEMPFPEAGGTSDVIAAVRDGEPYMPPEDPPVLPGGNEGIHMATGFGTSTTEELAREPAPRGDEDIHDEALLLLRQDSETSTLSLTVRVRQGVVHLLGAVNSADEAERAANLIGYVPGVVDVVDDTVIEPNADSAPAR